ncbi:MAG: outer membrane beta-barrel protein [Gemmatimonadota bacterium]|nr:outer membrane beta-barrel protein [Gemmatimonadota bacterium]
MKMQCRIMVAAGALLLVSATAPPMYAQSSGDGYLFHTPQGRLSLRAGYDHANANSDVFAQSVDLLTLKKSDFSGFTLGAEAAYSLGSRFELSADLGFTHKTTGSEYRKFIDNNNLPIEQSTTFDRVPLTVNARFYLTEPGRSIGKLAWIPNKVVPWIGAGAGGMFYRFRQQGDFVDYQNNNVFNTSQNDPFDANAWTNMYQAMAGADFSLSPHLAVRLDSRYLWAKAPLANGFSGFDRIDLSGVQGTLGLTYRL